MEPELSESDNGGNDGSVDAVGGKRRVVFQRWSWVRPQRATSIILRKDRGVKVQAVKGAKVSMGEGDYAVEAQAHFYLPRRIPRGWVTVHVEGDPEPVSTRQPRGYDAQWLRLLYGPLVPRWVTGAFKDSRKMGWFETVLIAAAAAAVGAFGMYEYLQRKTGGA